MSAQHNYVHHSAMRVVYGGSHTTESVILTNSAKCAAEFRTAWDSRFISKQERLYALFLDKSKKVIGCELINAGNYSNCPFDVGIISDLAREYGSRLIVLAHNHPSGIAKPSDQDISATGEAIAFFSKLNINVLDHIIITENDYFSFTDHKLIN